MEGPTNFDRLGFFKRTLKSNNESIQTDRLLFENSITVDFATIGSVLDEKKKVTVSLLNVTPKP